MYLRCSDSSIDGREFVLSVRIWSKELQNRGNILISCRTGRTLMQSPDLTRDMGYFRKFLQLPASTRSQIGGSLLLIALLSSAIGQYLGAVSLMMGGWLLFPWGAGFFLLWSGDYFFDSGRYILGEELRRGIKWFFFAFFGWSFLYVYASAFPTILVLYELLVVGTAIAGVAILTVFRLSTDRDVSSPQTLPSKQQMVLWSLPLLAFYLWYFQTGHWTTATTIGAAVAVAIVLVVMFRPTWVPRTTKGGH